MMGSTGHIELPDVGDDAEPLNVLMVEDSKVTQKVLCDFLARMGIRRPRIAETGTAAIALYREERPDLILLDAQLPDIDGFDVARQIRALEQGADWTAIIFLTGMDRDEDLARGIEAGGDDYLTKPVSEVVLQAKVRAMRRLIGMQRALVDVTQQLNSANKELQRISTTDGLTGIPNRRMFDEMAMREWRRCERMRKPLSLVLVDVDSFKSFNDRYGHQAGDECLKVVAAQVAKAASRATDTAARYGGEEFVLVLAETGAEGARCVANRLRQQVEALHIPHDSASSHQVTVSCGVAAVTPASDLSLEILLQSADRALYQAKAAGRNRVAVGEYGAPGS